MLIFENTRLWQSTLAERSAEQSDPEKDFRSRFRNSFLQFRRSVELVAQSIPEGIRHLTVHSVPDHIDPLWQIADMIAGAEFTLTPAEAYVLGGAFLLHDLSLALASYPNGIEDLQKLPIWRETAAQLLRQKLGRAPKDSEILNLDPQSSQLVLENVLRQNHASAAQALALNQYRYGPSDTTYFLIEDADLRTTYGPLIGAIAYSHWWSVDRLAPEFKNIIGAFPGTPKNWQIDPLKLACLLRCADACHIDARRAPGFLRALRKPIGVSDQHWRFQQYVQTPHLDKDRLIFSVTKRVPIGDADAWWIGYELIQTADRELRDIHALLQDTGRQTFAVNGVGGANDPIRLSRYISTEGWEPIATEIGVSNVASLVRKLGGRALYGNNPRVPLRELLQNARDAIVARREAENREMQWGQISVRIRDDGDQECVEVSDNGLGMSQKLLCGPFLDFGTSYWHTSLMIEEHPGLAASGFEPQGQFGIGFFSVFMWGERVRITTRSIHDAPKDTHILEFNAGLTVRPLLRSARPEEQKSEPGTTVEVWLDSKSRASRGFLHPGVYAGVEATLREKRNWTLSQLCEWLCPAIDVSISTNEKGESGIPVGANDWLALDSARLMYRLILHACENETICNEPGFEELASRMRPIVTPEGECIGRAALTLEMRPPYWTKNTPYPMCHTTAGVFRGWDYPFGDTAGILIGVPSVASRSKSEAIAEDRLDAMGPWATEQGRLVTQLNEDPSRQALYAHAIRHLGGNTGDLIIGRDCSGYISFSSLSQRKNLPDEIKLHDDRWLEGTVARKTLSLDEIAISTGAGSHPKSIPDPLRRADHHIWKNYWKSLWAAAIEALANAWNVPLVDVINASEIHGGARGTVELIRITPDIIRNPRGRK